MTDGTNSARPELRLRLPCVAISVVPLEGERSVYEEEILKDRGTRVLPGHGDDQYSRKRRIKQNSYGIGLKLLVEGVCRLREYAEDEVSGRP